MIRVDFIGKYVILINLLILRNSVYKLSRNKSQVNNRIQAIYCKNFDNNIVSTLILVPLFRPVEIRRQELSCSESSMGKGTSEVKHSSIESFAATLGSIRVLCHVIEQVKRALSFRSRVWYFVAVSVCFLRLRPNVLTSCHDCLHTCYVFQDRLMYVYWFSIKNYVRTVLFESYAGGCSPISPFPTGCNPTFVH